MIAPTDMRDGPDFRNALRLGDSVYISTGQGPVLARFIEWRGTEFASVRKYLKGPKRWKTTRTRVRRENILRLAPKPIRGPVHPEDPRPIGLCPTCHGTLVVNRAGTVCRCLNCGRSPMESDQILPLEEEPADYNW